MSGTLGVGGRSTAPNTQQQNLNEVDTALNDTSTTFKTVKAVEKFFSLDNRYVVDTVPNYNIQKNRVLSKVDKKINEGLEWTYPRKLASAIKNFFVSGFNWDQAVSSPHLLFRALSSKEQSAFLQRMNAKMSLDILTKIDDVENQEGILAHYQPLLTQLELDIGVKLQCMSGEQVFLRHMLLQNRIDNPETIMSDTVSEDAIKLIDSTFEKRKSPLSFANLAPEDSKSRKKIDISNMSQTIFMQACTNTIKELKNSLISCGTEVELGTHVEACLVLYRAVLNRARGFSSQNVSPCTDMKNDFLDVYKKACDRVLGRGGEGCS